MVMAPGARFDAARCQVEANTRSGHYSIDPHPPAGTAGAPAYGPWWASDLDSPVAG